MYLKKIELQGFKSFAGKTVLEFNKGITSVVGPNGSGKSNIADAVRWVLGEQSAKQLRGSKMNDVIFSGTEYRKSVGFAEVTLVIDNTKGRLPIDYTEVAVRRRLYRSGESNYSINGNNCRLKDIRDLFLDTGVGKDGYSIISQGKIHEILSVKSEDRRGIFEEAAGIMKYKVRKLESQRKLERTEQNLLRIGDIVRELSLQLEPLKEQATKAKEYLKLREILQKNEVGLYLSNYKNYKARIEKYDEDMTVYERDIKTFDNQLEQENKNNELRSRRLRELDSNEEDARLKLNDFLMSVETTKHEIQISKEKLNSIKTARERSLREIEQIELKKKQLSDDSIKRGQRIDYLQKQKNEYEEKLHAKNSELNEILSALGEKEKQISELRHTIDKKSDVASDIKIDIRGLELENISLSESIMETGKTRETLILEKDSHLLRMQDSKTLTEKLSLQVKAIDDEIESLQLDIEKTSKDLEKLIDVRNSKKTKMGILDNNMKILEDMEKRMEGYDSAVKDLFEEAAVENTELDGILGVAARELEVQPGYERAIEATMGGYLQSVLTEKPEDIVKAIDYLKEQNKGRASFLTNNPGINIKMDADIMAKVKSCKGFTGFAKDKAKFTENVGGYATLLLADTVIADTYANAKYIAELANYSVNTVSLEGDFFGKNGVVTGGAGDSSKSGILNREKRIKDLTNEVTELDSDLSEISKKIEKTTINLSQMRKKSEQLRNEISEKSGDLIKKKAESEAAQDMFNRITQRINSLEKTLELHHEKKEFNSTKIDKFRNKLAAVENEISGFRTEISSFEISHREQRNSRDEMHMDISDLRVSLNSVVESLENTGEAINRLDLEKQEIQSKKEMTLMEIDEFNDDEKRISEMIIQKQKMVENPDIEKTRLSDVLDSFVNERRSIEKEAERHIEKINKINKDILLLQNKYSKIEVSKATAVSEIQAMKDRMWEEYGLTHNEALARNDEIESIVEARNEISNCRKRLKQLGSVNVNAIEDYAKTHERHEFLSTQKQDLEESKEDLYKIIKEMNSIMRKTFVEKLAVINETFDKVFQELFEGGKAKIVLLDENDILESGIDIIVQPPGKKLQNMMLLSGGEKAFTAIALLFAILEINPSPFCIFDEIESALDETNVWKFGQYVRQYNHNTQFIMITHRKGTMEHSDSIYGVTMQEHGISKVVSMSMTD